MASLRAGQTFARRLTALPATARVLPALPLSTVTYRTTPSFRRDVHTAQPARNTATQLPNDNAPKVVSNAAPDAKEGKVHPNHLALFDLTGKVFVVTGGARGLGLSMAEGLVEAGGEVHCLDIVPEQPKTFTDAQSRMQSSQHGSLTYHSVNVSDSDALEALIAKIADKNQRLDGLVAAAGIQQVTPALDYTADDVRRMMDVNYLGVFLSARACARQMLKYKIQGSLCLIASMSGSIANKRFIAPVYNSSKAAVIQLTRNLAMEWGRVKEDGSGGIRVNSLSPGHIMTPMVVENFKRGEADKAFWEENAMLGRLAETEEFRGAGVFLLSKASSFMTGQNLIIDGGTTAW